MTERYGRKDDFSTRAAQEGQVSVPCCARRHSEGYGINGMRGEARTEKPPVHQLTMPFAHPSVRTVAQPFSRSVARSTGRPFARLSSRLQNEPVDKQEKSRTKREHDDMTARVNAVNMRERIRHATSATQTVTCARELNRTALNPRTGKIITGRLKSCR